MIDQWYERYSSELTGYIRSRGFTPEDAEDICGATFLEAVHVRPADIAPRAWLYLVARNRMIEAWRRDARRKIVPLEPWHDAAVEMPELQEPIPLDCLTKEQRIVIELRYLKDRTIAETSAMLGVSPSSIKGRQHRALEALRSELEREAACPNPNRIPTIDPHWIGEKSAPPPVVAPPIEVPQTFVPIPLPMLDQLCANGDGRLAYIRLRRRALCAICGLEWLCPDEAGMRGK